MIRLLQKLWADEAGYVLSAEAVTVGTVGVLGATVGVGAMSEAVNKELTETAYAIRSLDQSYCIPAQQGCGSWTAGSCYVQQDVEEARADLGLYIQDLENGTSDLPPREKALPTPADSDGTLDDQPDRKALKERAKKTREEQRRMRQRKREQQRLKQQQDNQADEATT
ncbi:MAG: hypothetical protein KDA93_23770 [Planctomycetaceae bacterium]|nr:hypothetical protein [Planctomycetaceae bacterium]